jgi:hypothetical protein
MFTKYGIGCVSRVLVWIFSFCLSGSIFFAHNLNFDGGLILSSLENTDIRINNVGNSYNGGNIYSLCLVKNNKKIFFRCSAKFLPMELGAIAEKLKLPEKITFPHDSVNSDNFLNEDFVVLAKEYCARDVNIVKLFMTKYDLSIRKILSN